MVDLSRYGDVSVMYLQLDPTKDTQSKIRVPKFDDNIQYTAEDIEAEILAQVDAHMSFDYRILEAILGRENKIIKKGNKETDFDSGQVAHVIGVESVGNNTVMLYWQTTEQVATNPTSGGYR